MFCSQHRNLHPEGIAAVVLAQFGTIGVIFSCAVFLTSVLTLGPYPFSPLATGVFITEEDCLLVMLLILFAHSDPNMALTCPL